MKRRSLLKQALMGLTLLSSLSISAMTQAATHTAQADEIIVENPWVGAPPPFAQALGAFAILKNPTDHPITLIHAKASGFDMVHLHQTINENGMHRMVGVKQLTIPPHGQIALKHGSYHIMLMGVHHLPKVGDQIPITLIFADHSQKTIAFPVKKGML